MKNNSALLLIKVLCLLVFSASLGRDTQQSAALFVCLNGKHGSIQMTRTAFAAAVVTVRSLDSLSRIKFDVEKFTVKYTGMKSVVVKGNNLKSEAQRINKLKLGTVVTISDVMVDKKGKEIFCLQMSPIVITLR